MSTDIANCPFCGESTNHKSDCWFELRDVGASHATLAVAWNRRATPPAPTPAAAEGKAERIMEVLTAERDQARAQYDHIFKVVMSVFNLAPKTEDIHLPDGRVMRFNDPNANETLHALGRAIWAIPEKLAAAPLPHQAAVQGWPVAYQWRRQCGNGWCAWAGISKGRYDRRAQYPNAEFRRLVVCPADLQTAPDQDKSASATTEKDA